MADFDKITEQYPSRVEGSDVKLRPIDALYMADANSFVARANTVTIVAALGDIKKQNEQILAALKNLQAK